MLLLLLVVLLLAVCGVEEDGRKALVAHISLFTR
jgi:hypothetical protein